MSAPIDVSTRDALREATEWALESNVILCDRGRIVYYEAVLRELAATPTDSAGDSRRADELARAFHETYERLAPSFGYETRKASAVPWEQVPENNRRLMEAVVAEVVAPELECLRETLHRLVSATDPYGLDMDNTPLAAHAEFDAAIFAAKELLSERGETPS